MTTLPDQAALLDVGPAVPPPAPPTVDPLAVACSYRGSRYASPCRALPGQPCRNGHGLPYQRIVRTGRGPRWHVEPEYHAERLAMAGASVPTYEQTYGHDGEATPVEDGAEETLELAEDADEAG